MKIIDVLNACLLLNIYPLQQDGIFDNMLQLNTYLEHTTILSPGKLLASIEQHDNYANLYLVTPNKKIKAITVNNIIELNNLISVTNDITTLEFEDKYTGVHSGTKGNVSLGDDYVYYCTQSGNAGDAIWKKSTIYKSIQ